MAAQRRDESGQAAVELGLILSALFILILGIFESGRAFYQYTSMSSAASYAARWGGVMGGTCAYPLDSSVNLPDWCKNQVTWTGSAHPDFWNLAGNQPLQTAASTSQPCIDTSGATAGTPHLAYYQSVAGYAGNNSTIAGAVVSHLDTNSGSPSFVHGGVSPGFNLSKLQICIQLNGSTYSGGKWTVGAGDQVAVYLYYPVDLSTAITRIRTIALQASAQYMVE